MALTVDTVDAVRQAVTNLHRALDAVNHNTSHMGRSDVVAKAQALLLALDLTPEYSPTVGATGSTVARLTSGVKSTAPVTGAGTTGVTPTIVNGVVTGYVLS